MDNAAAVRTARIAACPTTNVARNLPLVRERWTKMFVQPGGPVEGGETPRQALPENSLRNSALKFLAMYANISGECAVARSIRSSGLPHCGTLLHSFHTTMSLS